MRINYTNSTKRLAVIGDPISHSLSPIIHNALYNALGIDAFYQPLFIPRGRIDIMRDAIPMLSLKGFNITMPHKQSIFPLLDVIDQNAKLHQSVNTVCVRDGKLYGYSTDAQGFSLLLYDHNTSFYGQDIVFLGAGGACNTLALDAATKDAKSITILNRSLDKADALALEINKATSKQIITGTMSNDNLEKFIPRATMLINTTPLGMHAYPHKFESLAFLSLLPKNAIVCDLIYNPSETDFLKESKKHGHISINGLGMLIGQALVSFEHFFAITLGKNEKQAVIDALKSHTNLPLD